MDVIGYINEFIDEKNDGCDASIQKASIQCYCAAHDMTIVRWVTDEGACDAQERPGLEEVMYGDVQNSPIQAVVVAKSDRVSRDINLYYYYKLLLAKKDAQLICVADDFSSMGEGASLLDAFILFVAQMERNNITKRTSGGRKVKAAKGGYAGGKAPFGYKVQDGELVINEDEASAVRRIFALREHGYVLREIADMVSKEGWKARGGDKGITFSTVRNILANEKTYRGMYKYGDGDWVQGQHDAILE